MNTGVKLRIGMAFMFVLAVSFVATAQTMEEASKAYNAGAAANSENNLSEAIKQFEICITACEYLVENEESEEAETLLATVQAALPKLYYQLGTEQLQNQQNDEGLANVYKAKAVAKTYGDKETVEKANTIIPQVHYKIAATKYKAEDLDGAITELDKAIAANPDFSNAYYLKAVVLKKKDNDAAFKETAINGLAACKRSNDADAEKKIKDLGYKHFLKKGNDAKAAQKYDIAVGHLNSALEFNPDDATTLYLLASTYSAQNKLDDAIKTAENAIENEKGGAEAQAKIYLLIAEAQVKKGNNAAACAAYKKAAVGQFAEHANYQVQHVLKCE